MTSQRIDVMLRILKVADRALAQPDDKEGWVAIGRVLEMLTQHRQLLTSPDVGPSPDIPIHPLAFIFRRYGVRHGKAGQASWCVACGEAIDKSQKIIFHPKVGWTHPECKDWWVKVNFEALLPPAQAPLLKEESEDEDIPF